jgi:hypothetical protein
VRLWTRFRWTIHAHVVHPRLSPRHATPVPMRWGERACACFSLSSLIHTLASAQREIHLLNMPPSTSTSKIGLKNYYPPCMNRPLKFIRNFLLVWSNNSNMLQARDEDRTRQFTYDRSLLATHVDQWWWKTHFSAVNWGDGTNSCLGYLARIWRFVHPTFQWGF